MFSCGSDNGKDKVALVWPSCKNLFNFLCLLTEKRDIVELGKGLKNGECQAVGWNNCIKERERVGMEIVLPFLCCCVMRRGTIPYSVHKTSSALFVGVK